MVIAPSPFRSPAGQAIGRRPLRPMSTSVISSSIVTAPLAVAVARTGGAGGRRRDGEKRRREREDDRGTPHAVV